MSSRPFDVLNESIGKDVLILLKDNNFSIRGKLLAFDIHMNIVLEEAEMLENGSTKIRYGKLVVRGDNILMISP